MKQKTAYILLLFIIFQLIAAGCDSEITDDFRNGDGSGSSSIGSETLNINIATKTGEGTAADGDIINSLRIWLVRDDGDAIVDYYANVTTGEFGGTDKVEMSVIPESTAEISFHNVARGNYTLYAVANTDLNSSYIAGSTIDGSNPNDPFLTTLLPEIVNAVPPFDEIGGMPLSLISSFSVGAGVNEISAELERVCARIRLTINNRIAGDVSRDRKKIFISSASLGDFNPVSGYLFFKNHEIPGGYTSFKSLDGIVGIVPGESETIIDQYIYETGLDCDFILKLMGGIFPEETESVDYEYEEKYVAGPVTTDIIPMTQQYYIVSAGNQNYFMYDENGTTKLEQSTMIPGTGEYEIFYKENIQQYLWSFSSDTFPTQINAGTGNRMVQSSSQSINSDIYNGWRRFYYTDGKKNYYIGSNGNGQEVIKTWYNKGAPTSDTYGWYLRPATMEKFATGNLEGADRDINVTIDPVSVIDKWGNPVPLKDVCRNHSLDISVNVFYSENDGKLYFEVALWDEQDSNDTTFD